MPFMPFMPVARSRIALVLTAAGLALAATAARAERAERPNVLILTVDTLRADRMSAHGYSRPTTPNLDRLLRSGVMFTRARTVEPLTGPALCAMITSLFPHENGATRNGLRMHEGLPSLPKRLAEEGYATAAIVSNWTLRDKISGLAEHFDEYRELLRRKRWFGLVSSEAVAEHVTDAALDWLEGHRATEADRPFLFWVHYTDPHAPYEKHRAWIEPLGIERGRGKLSASDRYDLEVAYTDASIGRLLDGLQSLGLTDDTLVVFTSDHGESLGEHGYWGHGRHLYEPTLHVPLALTWPGRIEPRTIDAPALIIDVAPTVEALLGLGSRAELRGFDWTGVLAGDEPPYDRATQHQAHRGAVLSRHDSDVARSAGLLEVAVVMDGVKEILRVDKGRRWRFDLREDPDELVNLAAPDSTPTRDLEVWMSFVDAGLRRSDEDPVEPLDDETMEQLRALGYAD